MTIGFPAYHTETYTWQHADIYNSIYAAFTHLSWTITLNTQQAIHGKAGISIFSWGEHLELTFQPNGTLVVKSKCAMPTQCFDWGKNKRNVQSFLTALSQIETHKLSQAPGVQSPPPQQV